MWNSKQSSTPRRVSTVLHWSLQVLEQMHIRAPSALRRASSSRTPGLSSTVSYSSAKAGLIGLGKALAKEEGPSGITVNVIAPGVINTDMMAGFTAEDRAALAEETPVERLGEPDEIARTMVFLADEASGYITGQVLGVNGGLVI